MNQQTLKEGQSRKGGWWYDICIKTYIITNRIYFIGVIIKSMHLQPQKWGSKYKLRNTKSKKFNMIRFKLHQSCNNRIRPKLHQICNHINIYKLHQSYNNKSKFRFDQICNHNNTISDIKVPVIGVENNTSLNNCTFVNKST